MGAFSLAATKITGAGDSRWHFEVSGDAPTLEEADRMLGKQA